MVTINRRGAQRHAYLLDTNIFLEWDRPADCERLLVLAERAVQGDVLSVWQVLHEVPSAPLISAHRVARFDDHFTINLLINNEL
jgi:hypothetical protein